MSYQVLARKWRPRFFSEMAGQEHVLQALSNALDNNRLHHAYLFTGTRGVGKTTIARILCKCLNCDLGIRSAPCGECSSCSEIAEGRFIDLIEVDAASKTKIDDTRDLLDKVHYAPSRGRFKIYLIDEVHMLSTHSFNALLKTLEEPPPHVKFLLATTDPQKLPVTILSRCLQFNLKNLSPERIIEHLKLVLTEEATPFDESALWALARAADGSMRDALSLTDQAIGHGNGSVLAEHVNVMLGTIERSHVIDICQALAAADGAALLARIALMAEQAPDYQAALGDILSLWHQVAILQTVPDALDSGVENYTDIAHLAALVSREDVQLYYQICLLGRNDLALAPDARVAFDMVLLRALAFRPYTGSPARTGQPTGAAITQHKDPPVASRDLPVSAPTNDARAANEPALTSLTTPSELQIPVAIQSRPLGDELPPSVALNDFSPHHWIEVRKRLKIGASLGEIASHCVFSHRDGDQLHFILDSAQTSLFTAQHQDGMAVALSKYFAHTLSAVVTFGETSTETPRDAALRETAERHRDALESLNADPEVVKFKRVFNGTLDSKSVVPKG